MSKRNSGLARDLLAAAFFNPIIAIAFVVLILFILIAIFAPWIAPHPPTAQMLSMRLKPPGTEGYLLGTDQLGRDILSRLIHGAQLSLAVGFAVMVLTAILGVLIGLVSGYLGGKVDTVIMRIVDMWLAFPFLLLAISLVAVLGQGLDKMVLALVLRCSARGIETGALELRWISVGGSPGVAATEIHLSSRAPVSIPLAEHEIQPRDAHGRLVSADLDLLGRLVGRNARVAFQLVAVP